MATKLRQLRGQPLLEPPPQRSKVALEITPKDMELMLKELESTRQTTIGEGLAEQLYYMKMLGLPQPITKADLELMSAELANRRVYKNEEGAAAQLYYMKELGHPQWMNESERKRVEEHSRWMDENRGAEVAIPSASNDSYYREWLKTDERAELEELLDRYRKEGNGLWIAKMHYYLARLEVKPDPKQPPTPPLKEYTRR